MVVNIASILGAVLGMAALAYLVWLAAHPDEDRASEERARDFYDEHGHWPDEAPPLT